MGVSDDVSDEYPNAGIPAGVTFADLEPGERVIFDWDEGCDPRAVVAAFKVYEAVSAALRAKLLVAGALELGSYDPPEREIVTPAMIAAGKDELAGFDRERDLAAIAVERIYRAMEKLRRPKRRHRKRADLPTEAESAGAPANEIVATPEMIAAPAMIEAGVDTLGGFYLHFYEGIENPELIVRTIYETMALAR